MVVLPSYVMVLLSEFFVLLFLQFVVGEITQERRCNLVLSFSPLFDHCLVRFCLHFNVGENTQGSVVFF